MRRLKNEQIKAQQILLVLETADGNKETTLVSRQQALAAADAANLDLVQGELYIDVTVFIFEKLKLCEVIRASALPVRSQSMVHSDGASIDLDTSMTPPISDAEAMSQRELSKCSKIYKW